MTRAPEHRRKQHKPHPGAASPTDNTAPTEIGHPVFAQPQPTPDPTVFKVQHGSDTAAYKVIDELNREGKLAAIPFPAPTGLPEPRLTLADIYGADGARITNAITASGQLVFHSVGDTGNTTGPSSQNAVADKMTADFDDPVPADRPNFFFHLGDVIYSFGEAAYYYDQFYDPYRDYPAPIIAMAGNHDGLVSPLTTGVATLAAFLENFCASGFVSTPEAGGLSRTAQIQPGVFYTFEAPFLRILTLYSNVLEDPGVISNATIGDSQLAYLDAALERVKTENFAGALIIGHHHPAYTAGSKHGWSIDMLAQIDAACEKAGVWPHAVLSGHAHNYQRFTRTHGDMQIPYVIAGNGGHGLARLSKPGQALRTPLNLEVPAGSDPVVLESYDDGDYGYLRIVVTAQQLRIEYHPASDGSTMKTPDDAVTVDLASRTLVHFTG